MTETKLSAGPLAPLSLEERKTVIQIARIKLEIHYVSNRRSRVLDACELAGVSGETALRVCAEFDREIELLQHELAQIKGVKG